MNTTHINYQEYLESYAWKALKNTKLEEQPQCECCGTLATSVHHLSYERLGREKPEDIVSICEKCHEECHHVGGYQIKNDEEILRRRFEEVRNVYLVEKEIEFIELKEIFNYDFSKAEKPVLKKTIRGSSTITELSFSTNNHPIFISGYRNQTQLLTGGKVRTISWDLPLSNEKYELIWLDPFFNIDQCLYYAYRINYGNEDDYESIPRSQLDSYYGLRLPCFDINSFEVISFGIVKDKQGVYLVKFLADSGFLGAKKINIYKTGINPKGFVQINCPYYKNAGNIYCEIGNNYVDCFPENILQVKGADLETFETLDEGRARDKNYIYDYGKIIEHVIHEDENNDYCIGNSGGCSYGEYGEDCETLFSDRSDWCSYCKGE